QKEEPARADDQGSPPWVADRPRRRLRSWVGDVAGPRRVLGAATQGLILSSAPFLSIEAGGCDDCESRRISDVLTPGDLLVGTNSPMRPKKADRPIKTPTTLFVHELIERPDAVRRANPDLPLAAPGLEVLVNVAWDTDEPPFRSHRQFVGAEVARRAEP